MTQKTNKRFIEDIDTAELLLVSVLSRLQMAKAEVRAGESINHAIDANVKHALDDVSNAGNAVGYLVRKYSS